MPVTSCAPRDIIAASKVVGAAGPFAAIAFTGAAPLATLPVVAVVRVEGALRDQLVSSRLKDASAVVRRTGW